MSYIVTQKFSSLRSVCGGGAAFETRDEAEQYAQSLRDKIAKYVAAQRTDDAVLRGSRESFAWWVASAMRGAGQTYGDEAGHFIANLAVEIMTDESGGFRNITDDAAGDPEWAA